MRPTEYREIARKLRKRGMTQREIAAVLGVGQSTICLWLNPEIEARVRDDMRERYQKRIANA